MADRGCEVHSFDPTGSTMAGHMQHAHPSGRVHFHPWGLSSELPHRCERSAIGSSVLREELETRRRSGGTYGNLTGPLYSLDRIVRKLGHSGRRISLLKIDCEGCEWDAMHHLAMQSGSGPGVLSFVDAIYLELHLGLQMSTSQDLAKFATAFHLLFEREGFRLWWVHPNAARAPGAAMHAELHKLPYSRHVWQPGPAPLSWEIALRRVPPMASSVSADDGAATYPANNARPRCPRGALSARTRP